MYCWPLRGVARPRSAGISMSALVAHIAPRSAAVIDIAQSVRPLPPTVGLQHVARNCSRLATSMRSSRFSVIWPRWCCRTRRSSTICLFRSSAETLLEVARNPKRLGAEIGFCSVLHRWSQKLETHPHVHCVVPAGGWSPDHTHWVPASEWFFLPMSCCVLTLSLDEFLRRFLWHVLPKGFVRIRHFGFLANRKRATNLPLCFPLLGCRRCGVIA
jgi:hypothetical protein